MDDQIERLNWFQTVILPHEGALRARLRRALPRGHDVDDHAAEVLARAYAADGWRLVDNGRGYLFGIARNLLIDLSRRENIVSFEVMANLDLLQSDDRTRAGLEARAELRRVEAAIDTLPIQCRRVFVLRRVHDYTTSEIAEQMGLSVSTVEKHLTKAVVRVAHLMADDGEDGLGQPRVEQRPAGDRAGRRAPGD